MITHSASNPDFPAQIAVNCFISITVPAASNVTGRLKISETDRNLGSTLQAGLSAWVIGLRLVLCTNSYLCGNCDGFGFLSNCILISMRLGSHCTRSNANLVLLWGSQRSQGKRRMSYRRKFHKGPTLYYPNSSATFHTTTYLINVHPNPDPSEDKIRNAELKLKSKPLVFCVLEPLRKPITQCHVSPVTSFATLNAEISGLKYLDGCNLHIRLGLVISVC